MRRNVNWAVWAGFGVTLFAALSYLPLFVYFPSTRDVPWVNLLLFFTAGCLLAIGVYRAFRHSDKYRGKVSGSILGILSLIIFGLFCFGTFYEARNIPSAAGALTVGQQAPDFKLTASDGKPMTLSQLRQGSRAVLVIFYRGHW